MKALLYLNVHLFKNKLMSITRNPKQVAPFLVVAFLFLFMSVANFILFRDLTFVALPFSSQMVKPYVFTFLVIATWFLIIYFSGRNMLIFSLSEIDFLFPSPLKRKTLLLNRILTNYALYFFFILGFSGYALFNSSLMFGFSFWRRAIFIWIAAMSTVVLAINIGLIISLVISRFSELKQSRFRWVPLCVLLIFAGALSAYTFWLNREGVPLIDAVITAFNSSVVKGFMIPPGLAADVAVSWTLTVDVGLKIVFLVFLCAITLWGILSVETHFYETAETISRQRWEQREKLKRLQVVVSEPFARRMFKVHPFGWKSTVLIWKNLVGATRDARNLFTAAVFVVLYAFIFTRYFGIGAIFSFFIALIVVQGIRWDFREDLRRIEIIKLIPDSNSRIVLSEIAVTTFLSIVFSYSYVFVSYLLSSPDRLNVPLGFTLGFLPLFCMIVVVVYNITALYYPQQDQRVVGMVGMLCASVVCVPLVILVIFFSVSRYGLILVFPLYAVIAFVLFVLLQRKYRLLDVTNP
ncbi:MAG: hypothetical protein HXS44_04525 [Theionarchaea archaeon]|nr:hypothetical protein [Theionarchaea archaeon]